MVLRIPLTNEQTGKKNENGTGGMKMFIKWEGKGKEGKGRKRKLVFRLLPLMTRKVAIEGKCNYAMGAKSH